MAKNNALKKEQREIIDEFDYSDDTLMASGDDVMVGMMGGLVQGSRHQMETAIELTKIIVSRHPEASLNKDAILSIFQRASEVVSKSTPLNELWERMCV